MKGSINLLDCILHYFSIFPLLCSCTNLGEKMNKQTFNAMSSSGTL